MQAISVWHNQEEDTPDCWYVTLDSGPSLDNLTDWDDTLDYHDTEDAAIASARKIAAERGLPVVDVDGNTI